MVRSLPSTQVRRWRTLFTPPHLLILQIRKKKRTSGFLLSAPSLSHRHAFEGTLSLVLCTPSSTLFPLLSLLQLDKEYQRFIDSQMTEKQQKYEKFLERMKVSALFPLPSSPPALRIQFLDPQETSDNHPQQELKEAKLDSKRCSLPPPPDSHSPRSSQTLKPQSTSSPPPSSSSSPQPQPHHSNRVQSQLITPQELVAAKMNITGRSAGAAEETATGNRSR